MIPTPDAIPDNWDMIGERDLVNKLEAEAKLGRQGRLADRLVRVDLVVLDELGYLPFAQTGGQLVNGAHKPGHLGADITGVYSAFRALL